MEAIREFAKVHNHSVNIKLPNDFDYDEVEVIIMPKEQEDWSYLEKEIDKGDASGLSTKSHEEIMQEIKSKYV